jgi:hypothetical protein
MKKKKLARIFKALAIVVLCFPLPLWAATNDNFIQGYASAVLEREFRMKKFSLSVVDEAVRLTTSEPSATDHDKVMAALLSIPGVKKVEIVDARGAVVASAAAQAGATEPAVPSAITPHYELGFLPSGKIFEPLIADPRWPRFSMGYRYFPSGDSNVGSATFGESIALYRNRGENGALGELGFQAGVFSIFDLSAPSSDLVNTDFFVALQGSYRANDLSTIFRIFHQSSHLGDEFLLRNRIDRVNLSYEGVDLKLSYRFFDWLRLYAGGGYMFDISPSGIKPWATQGGVELQTPWRFWRDSTRFVSALDVQNWQENKWSTAFSVRTGFQFERPQSFMRKISLLFEYYKGHSPNGQFFTEKIEYFGPGLHLDF